MDKSHKSKHAEWKESYQKTYKWFLVNDILEQVKLIYGGKYQNSACPRTGRGDVGGGDWLISKRELAKVMMIFICSGWVTQVCAFVKTQQMCT